MSSSLFARNALVGWALALATAGAAWGQTHYMTNGVEYPIAGALAGDQVHPRIAMGLTNGFLVWEDNATDGNGLGISARRLDGSLSGTFSSFRVNQIAAGDQEHPQVALLKNGGAAFVWQGGKKGFQNIYARFLSRSNTWVGGDVLVNTYTNKSKFDPAIAALPDGNVIIVWSSLNQKATNSLQDVYGQRLSSTGLKLGGEFLINQFTAFNQRTPAVSPVGNNRFVVVWVSEMERSGGVDQHDANYLYSTSMTPSIDVYARLFGTNGSAAGSEFLVNTSSNTCANPAVTGDTDGGFMVAWGEKDIVVRQNSWDIWARHFSGSGVGQNTVRVNSQLYGDQYGASLTAIGTDYFAVWTSLGQDGSRDGVFGQFLRADGTPVGSEIRVNTTTISQQIHPILATDGASRYMVVWSSFVGAGKGFDLYAQRYSTDSQPLGAPDAPFVSALSSNALSITWAPVDGLPVGTYQIFADGATTTPTGETTNTWWTMTGLAPASIHSIRLAYQLTTGRRSPLSAATSGRTYSGGATWGGIPQDWMVAFFGSDIFSWPSPYVDSDGDGVSNLNEFLQGTNPTNSASVLRQRLDSTQQGPFLSWNTQPGLVYQVQVSTNMNSWSNLGSPRFAAGNNDSLYVGGSRVAYFRVLRVR